MSAAERLASALLASDDLAPDAIAALMHDNSAFPEVARVLTIADEWLSQDIADGEALRLLRDALPEPQRLGAYWTNRGWVVQAHSRGRLVGTDLRSPMSTIAEAADACRKALPR